MNRADMRSAQASEVTTWAAGILSLFLPGLCSAQPQLIADLNTDAIGSSPDELTGAGGLLALEADTGLPGSEVIIIDPITRTFDVLDIIPGGVGSGPQHFASVGDFVYFEAENPDSDEQLYRYDTTTGERTEYPINPGDDIDISDPPTVLDGRLFFTGDVGNFTVGLVHDPITETTMAFAGTDSVPPVRVSPNTEHFALIGEDIYFVAYDADSPDDTGDEIWRADLVSPGMPELITDIRPGSTDSNPDNLFVAGGKLFFSADDVGGNDSFFVFDPSTDMVTEITDVPGAALEHLVFDGSVYIRSGSLVSGKFKNEIYRIDPSTLQVEQLTEGGLNSFGRNPTELTELDGKIYFSGNVNADGTDSELFVLDPETDQVLQAGSILPGGDPDIAGLATLGGKLYFTADDETSARELWVHDPQTEISTQLTDFESASGFVAFEKVVVTGGLVFFEGTRPDVGSELFAWDPVAEEVVPFDLNSGNLGSEPEGFVEAGGDIYFIARTEGIGTTPRSLMRYDPALDTTENVNATASGPVVIPSASNAQFDTPIIVHAGKIFMKAGADGEAVVLVRYDPATNSFEKIGSGNTAPLNSRSFYSASDGYLYFSASNTTVGFELFVYDSNLDEVEAIDVNSGTANSLAAPHVEFNGKLFFEANAPGVGYELHSYDPDSGMMELVVDANPGLASGLLRLPKSRAVVVGDSLYFGAGQVGAGAGIELMRLTDTGVLSTIDVLPGTDSSSPEFITPVGDRVAFASGFPDQKVYVYDPAADEVTRIGTGDFGRGTLLTGWNDRLYMSALDPASGAGLELYCYNPATEALTRLTNLDASSGSGVPGPVSTYVTQFPIAGDLLFFRGDPGGFAFELYAVLPDETVVQATDINPGDADSRPEFLTSLGGRLYFAAENFEIGTEPWLMDPGTIYGPHLNDIWLVE